MTTLTWEDATRSRIRRLQDALLATMDWTKGQPEYAEALMLPYREMLEDLYERDFPLAKLADQSDLLVHVQGPAASAPHPRVSVVTRVLSDTRDLVTRLAKQIGGVVDARVPAALDMGVVGFARGSLFVGFSTSEEAAGASTQRAVELIGQASRLVSDDATLENVAAAFRDPAERDLAVNAVRHMSPSGQAGIREIDLLGRRVTGRITLNISTRRHARQLMAQPVRVGSPVSYVGTVRETDLDESRFALRNIDGQGQLAEIRCAHEMTEDEAKSFLGKRVRVHGLPELGTTGEVRLLWVDEIELVA